MNRKFWIGLTVGCISSLAVLAIIGTASASSGATGPASRDVFAPQPITSTVKAKASIGAPYQPNGGGGPAHVFTTFTYQGMLKKGSAPYTGSCNMLFRLYDSYTGGALIGTAGPLPTPVSMNNGLFTTWLDFGDVFTGWNRYLETDVSCPAGSGITETLSPRTLLYGTPYALSLRPGATITGNTGTNAIIYAEDADTNGTGLQGVANSGSNAWGVAGFSDSGIGVYGASSSDSGYGVYGSNSSNNGPGVYGQGSLGIGVKGTGTYTGVYGLAGASNSSVTYGVYGRAYSINGYGTYGYSLGGTGAAGVSNSGIGVYASSASGNPIAAYVGSTRVFYVANSGNVYADGSYNCGLGSGCFNTGIGADVAERINATDSMEPGDLVEIDPNQPDQFRLARTAYSTLVAGVVSTNPGVTMNNNDLANNDTGQRTDQRPLLALVGKVPVKVSAENGPIHIGDLLVASSTPGHAMRAGSNPALGTVIGKALGSLDKGTGTILMLVMLR